MYMVKKNHIMYMCACVCVLNDCTNYMGVCIETYIKPNFKRDLLYVPLPFVSLFITYQIYSAPLVRIKVIIKRKKW